MMNDELRDLIEARPTPTREQYEAAEACLRRLAPDLLDMVIGGVA
ncbi:hypothetical protein [Arthrobacter sp. Alg241-R88]|nr:hypothetical protein [Arthrobacter sp. Alg241-R88]